MIANPDKFKAIVIKKDGQDTSGITFRINDQEIQSSKEVTLLGIRIDNKLYFDSHISELCTTAAKILNSLKRQNRYVVGEKIRSMVTNTYVLSQFNYCPLVWHFCGKGSLHKIEKIHETALRFIYSDNISEYLDLLEKANTTTLYLKRVRIIAQDVYKAINNIGPKYAKELIMDRPSKYPTRRSPRYLHSMCISNQISI